MKKNPLVSVIISTYNSERTLEKCLASIKNQNYPYIELIVVDNYSKDSTLEIAKKFTTNIFQKGPERCAQRNFGAIHAKGDFLLIHDSDIYFGENLISECVEKCDLDSCDALVIPERSIGEGFWTQVKSFERSFYLENKFMEASRFFKKSVFDNVGRYDENLVAGEDYDLHFRIVNNGYKIGRVSDVVFHDEGKLNLFGSSKKKKYYANDFFNKYALKHPKEFQMQMSFFVRFPLNKVLVKGLRHPILFISMVVMKVFEFLASKNII
jgi:glycosyltransferase involved in cell wall biosynthesis